jgi:hypothetical protein
MQKWSLPIKKRSLRQEKPQKNGNNTRWQVENLNSNPFSQTQVYRTKPSLLNQPYSFRPPKPHAGQRNNRMQDKRQWRRLPQLFIWLRIKPFLLQQKLPKAQIKSFQSLQSRNPGHLVSKPILCLFSRATPKQTLNMDNTYSGFL